MRLVVIVKVSTCWDTVNGKLRTCIEAVLEKGFGKQLFF